MRTAPVKLGAGTGYAVLDDRVRSEFGDALLALGVRELHCRPTVAQGPPAPRSGAHCYAQAAGRRVVLLLTRQGFSERCVIVETGIRRGEAAPRMTIAHLRFPKAAHDGTVLLGQLAADGTLTLDDAVAAGGVGMAAAPPTARILALCDVLRDHVPEPATGLAVRAARFFPADAAGVAQALELAETEGARGVCLRGHARRDSFHGTGARLAPQRGRSPPARADAAPPPPPSVAALLRATSAPDVYSVQVDGADRGVLAVPCLSASRELAAAFAGAAPGAALPWRCYMHATFGRWAPVPHGSSRDMHAAARHAVSKRQPR